MMGMEPPLTDPRIAAAALVQWYAEMGVDTALDEAPRDRFEEARPKRSGRAAGRAALTAGLRCQLRPTRWRPPRGGWRGPPRASTNCRHFLPPSRAAP